MGDMLMETHPFGCGDAYRKNNLHIRYGLLFQPKFIEYIMSRLESEVHYADPKDCMIRVYGKWYEIPRRQIAYGDPGVSYEYSGKKVQVLEWTPIIKELLNVVNSVCGQSYNFVLVNKYRDGADKIGFHADDEESIDKSTPIASVSFGAERDFMFRHKFDATKKMRVFRLESGSILLMEPPTNEYWLHSLPPCKNCTTPRVNLTFRKIKSD